MADTIGFAIREVASLDPRPPRGYRSIPQARGSPAIWWRSTRAFRSVRWSDRATLRVGRGGSVRIDLVGRAERVLPDILNLALALSLSQRGYQILHAAGICSAGRSAAILGPSGSGKSSTVLAAARLGAAIVSDEIVPFREEDGAFVVPGGNPRIRVAAPLLDPGELRTLGAPPGRGRKIEVDLELLGLPCAAAPSRLSLLILLGDRHGAQAPRVRPKRLAPVEALGLVLAAAFTNRVLATDEREAQFQIGACVVRELPCYLLSVREGVANASAAARWVVEELDRSGV